MAAGVLLKTAAGYVKDPSTETASAVTERGTSASVKVMQRLNDVRLIESRFKPAMHFHTDDCRRLEKVSRLIRATSAAAAAVAVLFHLHLISFAFTHGSNQRPHHTTSPPRGQDIIPPRYTNVKDLYY